MFEHSVRVRYAEVDMQRVVYNANYLAYVDDTVDCWFRSQLGTNFDLEVFDFVVKKAEITWSAPASVGDVIDLTADVRRWGRTSFDIAVDGSVAGDLIFTATMTYVAVEVGAVAVGAQRATPVPESVRRALSVDAKAPPSENL